MLTFVLRELGFLGFVVEQNYNLENNLFSFFPGSAEECIRNLRKIAKFFLL